MGKSLNTKQFAAALQEAVKLDAEDWKKQGVRPALAVILVKGDPASEYYANSKMKLAQKLGIEYRLIILEADVAEDRLLAEINRLNEDPDTHGIMLELPLPKHLNVAAVSDALLPVKDVDGICSANKWAVYTGEPGLYPATPESCIRILKYFGYELQGKHVVLIGRGETVGRPLMQLLLRENATLTVCHSHTQQLTRHIAQADILIAAAGKANLVTADMVHPRLVIIDAGINETETGIAGDVSPDAMDAAQAMTPVPGGVGTVTTTLLFEHLLKAVKLQKESGVHADVRL
ncbi:bifunctional 5,10-methylenetetrahydrofolate dehydrogenase/5,10-methenyltetrahydrofolate cyclohydrolase [Paenibacillus thalictri]|uniref:Bifunctional protein FolD n=1 Tax=Paenibacillus thalictri TaxID=2527873 RepID=A0A4Q9DVW5_9BACL|nr:bifunctional 5,10-methylenetetrahydrofolate dehydrogenase/5,10-methenyltetrahydrofolate cyclohydrolase [Paenibacillus thalictri]TBL81169.1 bifunctional 5,10-methylenetetrahydrofolate dehydrogenase/5,10-methenyltetrahydrofolate cyclohydrolase [Paenibacillus thalictri]